MVSLLVRYATTNHIFVCTVVWAFSVELGRAVGAVGGLIMAGEGFEFLAESEKDAMVLKHKMCLKWAGIWICYRLPYRVNGGWVSAFDLLIMLREPGTNFRVAGRGNTWQNLCRRYDWFRSTRCVLNQLIFGYVQRVTIYLTMVESQLLVCWSRWESMVSGFGGRWAKKHVQTHRRTRRKTDRPFCFTSALRGTYMKWKWNKISICTSSKVTKTSKLKKFFLQHDSSYSWEALLRKSIQSEAFLKFFF